MRSNGWTKNESERLNLGFSLSEAALGRMMTVMIEPMDKRKDRIRTDVRWLESSWDSGEQLRWFCTSRRALKA